MKYLKTGLLLSAVGIGAFAVGRIRSLIKSHGSVLFYFPGKNFYVFGVYPFDDTYRDELEDLAVNMDYIFDDYMEEIAQQEMLEMMVGSEQQQTSSNNIDRYFDLS